MVVTPLLFLLKNMLLSVVILNFVTSFLGVVIANISGVLGKYLFVIVTNCGPTDC